MNNYKHSLASLRELTYEIKKLAKKLGAELVGVANIERFKNAPVDISPQGLLPTAKSVVVVGVIWLDASIELTEKEIAERFYNPYDICEGLTDMNGRLNHIVFNLAKFLEKNGYRSIPLPATGLWRWKPYKTVKESFGPPLAHRYAAVAAGLGEVGWHNSFISPEYGPRVRINSVITEAPLEPDPLYSGPPLCDRCMRCVKACPYDRFRKEVTEIKELEIGEKKFKIPITNKWRCYLCYYEINPRFLPKEITPEVAYKIVTDGREPKKFIMDSAACLAACLPPNIRQESKELYPNSVKRKRKVKKVNIEKVTQWIKEKSLEAGMDYLYIASRKDFLKKNIDLKEYMPGASSIVLFGTINFSDQISNRASDFKRRSLLFDLSHHLQHLGYYTLPQSYLNLDTIKRAFNIKDNNPNFYHLITSLPLKPLKMSIKSPQKKRKISSDEIKSFIFSKGGDLVGITSVNRLNKLLSFLKEQKTIDAENKPKLKIGGDWNFTVKGIKKLKLKKPTDYLHDAKSVIVVGIRYPSALIERVAKKPSDHVGAYVGCIKWILFDESHRLIFDTIKFLIGKGYKAIPHFEANYILDYFNKFSAIAAGLGELGWCGEVLTPKYGYTQKFFSIITDAELTQDPIYDGEKLCRKCFKCIKICPAKAISRKKVAIKLENKVFEFGKIDRLKCEWAQKFGLVGEEGPKYMGSNINLLPPAKITLNSFNDAINKIKRLKITEKLDNWAHTFERCLSACPMKLGKLTDISFVVK